MFSFIKNHLQKIYTSVTTQLHALFSRSTLDAHAFKELEQLLIAADTGVKTTRHILEQLKKKAAAGSLATGADLHTALRHELNEILTNTKQIPNNPTIYLMVGINGSGKTTFISKLAHHFNEQGKKLLLVAADTFRAAATEQLSTWATRTNSHLITGAPGQDPASVVFTGCITFKQNNYDTLIIDTAGRLQTKSNLMKELEKIKKIISRTAPDATLCTLLTIDSMLGQNSLEQAHLFNESTQVDGIVLTKMDGTGKGGIVFAIAQELGIPIMYLSYGEQLEQLKVFNATDFVDDLLTST